MRHWIAISLLTAYTMAAHAACPVDITASATKEQTSAAVTKLGQFTSCDPSDPTNDRSPCNTFASRGLEALYGISDFKLAGVPMSANGIADFVERDSQWVKLGVLLSAENNACAQALANSRYPVIAAKRGANHGHVAIIIPGSLRNSSSWGMPVASSASFLLDQPLDSYVEGPLSKAFGFQNASSANFYYRKPDLPIARPSAPTSAQ